MVLETDSDVEQDEEGSVVDSVAEVLLVEVELSEDVIEGVRSVVGAALAEVCEALEAGLVVGSDEAELDSALEDVEEELEEEVEGEVEEEEELVEDASSVTVCVVTMVTGAVAVTVVGDSGGTTEMSVWVTVFVESFAVAVTVISGVAVGDDVTVWTTVVVLPCSVAAGLPPSMGTME